jgi:hypothetical protein
MKDDKGVYAVARSIWNDADFEEEPFTQREAWLWLIGQAAWRSCKIRGNTGKSVAINRGEFSIAVRFMAEKFQWTKSRIDRFIHTLKNRDMIRDTSRDGFQVYSISNYNEFQVVGLPKRADKRDGEWDSSGTAAGQQRDKEETLETLEDNIIPARPALPDWLDRETWLAFAEMRKKIKKPLTDHASKLVLQKLDRWRQLGHDPTAILNYSIEGSYQGIFEPKTGKNDKRNAHRNFAEGSLDAAEEFTARQRESDRSGSGEAGVTFLAPRLRSVPG